MKINYMIKLKTPALTTSLGIIGKDVDVVVKVDKNEKPFFNGKHIKGILRERVAQFKLGLGVEKKRSREFYRKIFWQRRKLYKRKQIQ